MHLWVLLYAFFSHVLHSSLAKNADHLTQVKLQLSQEQLYPFLPVCRMSKYGCQSSGFLTCAIADACDCTQVPYKHSRSLHWKLTPRVESLAASWSGTCATTEPGFQMDSTNWATSPTHLLVKHSALTRAAIQIYWTVITVIICYTNLLDSY